MSNDSPKFKQSSLHAAQGSFSLEAMCTYCTNIMGLIIHSLLQFIAASKTGLLPNVPDEMYVRLHFVLHQP